MIQHSPETLPENRHTVTLNTSGIEPKRANFQHSTYKVAVIQINQWLVVLLWLPKFSTMVDNFWGSKMFHLEHMYTLTFPILLTNGVVPGS